MNALNIGTKKPTLKSEFFRAFAKLRALIKRSKNFYYDEAD